MRAGRPILVLLLVSLVLAPLAHAAAPTGEAGEGFEVEADDGDEGERTVDPALPLPVRFQLGAGLPAAAGARPGVTLRAEPRGPPGR